MHRCLLVVCILFPGFVFAQAKGGGPVTDSTVVIQAGSSTLTKAEFEQLLKGEPSLKGKITPEIRRSEGQRMGRAFALESEAKRRKLDQRPDIKLRIRSAIQQLLAAELIEELREEYLKDDIGKLRSHYEKVKKQYEMPRVRQILVRTKGSSVAAKPGAPELSVDEARKKAQEIRQRIVGGADFATVARQDSDELGTGPKGGEYGFVARGSTAAEFEAAVYSLPIGQVSEPVQTEFGFFILQVEERQPQAFDKIKEVLANDLAHKELESAMAKVKLNEAYFGGGVNQ